MSVHEHPSPPCDCDARIEELKSALADCRALVKMYQEARFNAPDGFRGAIMKFEDAVSVYCREASKVTDPERQAMLDRLCLARNDVEHYLRASDPRDRRCLS